MQHQQVAPAASGQAAPSVERLPSVIELLAFRLGTEEYGIDILKVQEIRGYDAVTRIANAPPFVKGVINLRGVIVPIIDLRIRFALERADYDQFTVVIVLNLGQRVVGIVVDSVSDVIQFDPGQIRPAPAFPSAPDTRFLTGIGMVGDRMVILFDIERMLLSADMGLTDEPLAETEGAQ